jgi:hypothetical protein
MTNIIDRARELLTCDELRGRVPQEVQALLADIVALEPVCCMTRRTLNKAADWRWDSRLAAWTVSAQRGTDEFLYTLGAPMTPREAAAILREWNNWFLSDDVEERGLPTQNDFHKAMDIAAKYIEDNDHE